MIFSLKLLHFWGFIILGVFVTNSQQIIFEKQYGTEGKAEFAYDIIETYDSGYLMIGITMNNPNPTNTLDGKIKKTDFEGNLLWEKTFTGMQNTNDFLLSVAKKNNHFLLAGSRYVYSPLPPWYIKKQFWLLEIDQNGSLIQQKNYGGDDDEGATKIISIPDGGYMLIGFTQSFGSQQGGKDIWLLKLNSSLDTIWSKAYDLGGVDEAIDIIAFNNKFIILANSCIEDCNTAAGGLGFFKSNSYYLLIDSIGNIETIRNISPGLKNNFRSIAPTNDGGFIITGSTDKATNNYCPDLWILKLNANLDTVWTKIYGKPNTYDGGKSIFQLYNGQYIVAGYTQSYVIPGVRDYDCPWIMLLNHSGDSIWSLVTGSVNNDGIIKAFLGSDNSFIGTGYYDLDSRPESLFELNMGEGKFYLIKLSLTTSSSKEYLCDNKNNLLLIQSDKTIEILCSEKNYQVSLFDITGKIILNEKNIRVFSTEKLNSGLYLLNLYTPQKHFTKKFILF